MTKVEMARIIVQVLYNSKKKPAANHGVVIKIANRKKDVVKESYEKACKLLLSNSTRPVKSMLKPFNRSIKQVKREPKWLNQNHTITPG